MRYQETIVTSVEKAGRGAILCPLHGGAGTGRGVRDKDARLIRAEFLDTATFATLCGDCDQVPSVLSHAEWADKVASS